MPWREAWDHEEYRSTICTGVVVEVVITLVLMPLNVMNVGCWLCIDCAAVDKDVFIDTMRCLILVFSACLLQSKNMI